MSQWLKLPTTAGTTKISDKSTYVDRIAFGDGMPTLGAAMTFLDGNTSGTVLTASPIFALAIGTMRQNSWELGFRNKDELHVAHGTEDVYLLLNSGS